MTGQDGSGDAGADGARGGSSLGKRNGENKSHSPIHTPHTFIDYRHVSNTHTCVSNNAAVEGGAIAPSSSASATGDDGIQRQDVGDEGSGGGKGVGGGDQDSGGGKGAGGGDQDSGGGDQGSGGGDQGSGDQGSGGGKGVGDANGGGGKGVGDVLNSGNVLQSVNTEFQLSLQTYTQKLSTLMEQEQLHHNNALQSLQEKFDLDLTNQKQLLVDMQQQRDEARSENETLRLKNKELNGEYRAFFTHLEGMKSKCLHDPDADTAGNPAGGSAL